MDDVEELRAQTWWSLAHKLFLISLAIIAFSVMGWLGTLQRHREAPSVNPDKAVAIVNNALANDAKNAGSATKTAWKPDRVAFSSREHMTQVLQDVAERDIWREFMGAARPHIIRLEELAAQRDTQKAAAPTQGERDDYARLAEFLAKQEAFTRTRIAATRQAIAVEVMQGKYLTRSDGWDTSIFNPKSPFYVLFEIAWYACLLIGILAISYLVVTLLTALPITEAETFWTKRIGDILERAGIRAASIATPLLGTALAVGVVASVAQATVPGGYASDRRTTLTHHEHATTIRLGDTAIDARQFQELRTDIHTMRTDIRTMLLTAGRQDGGTPTRTPTPTTTPDATLEEVRQLAKIITDEQRKAAERFQAVTTRLTETKAHIDSSTGQLTNALGTTDRNIREHVVDERNILEKELMAARRDIDEHFARDDNARSALLAQSADADLRNYWARTLWFGRYAIGPGTIPIFTAYLREKAGATEAELEAVRAALAGIGSEPRSRAGFEQRLEKAIETVKNPRAATMLKTYRRILIDLSGLRRD